jgi:hypothetical protein
MQPRAIHYISAVLIGLGIGVLVYRFGILGLFWAGSVKWVFPAAGAGLMAAGFKIQSMDTQSERPAVATRIAIAIVGIGASMGLLYLIVPPLSDISLARKNLPGFSFEAPSAKPDVNVVDYNTGTLTWKQIGGANAVLSISWQVGSASKEDLEIGMKALAGEIGGSTPMYLTMAGPNGTQVDTVTVDTNKNLPLRMSVLPCGNRGIILMSIGEKGIESVHARMLKTFICTPDAAKESAEPGTVRVAVALPGWTTNEKEHGQITLMSPDQTSLLIMREISAQQVNLPELVTPLLNAFGGNFTAKPIVGDRVPFSGTLEGEKVEGWARRVACPTHGVLILCMANTAEDAEAAYNASSGAGCLRPGEKPPVWADAPPVAPEGDDGADEAAPAAE